MVSDHFSPTQAKYMLLLSTQWLSGRKGRRRQVHPATRCWSNGGHYCEVRVWVGDVYHRRVVCADLFRGDFVCCHCGTAVVEEMAHRTLAGQLAQYDTTSLYHSMRCSLADKMVAHLVAADALQMVRSSIRSSPQHRYQAIPVTLRGLLVGGVGEGGREEGGEGGGGGWGRKWKASSLLR